jgi:NAD+ kinase
MKPIKKALVVYYAENYGTLDVVGKALKQSHILASFCRREDDAAIKKNLNDVDAVIAVGGDGTLLKAAHFISDTPIFHISSSSKVNEGFFARATNDDASAKIRMLASGNYKITPLMRLSAEINRKKLSFDAVNEVYAGSKQAYHTSIYDLEIGGKREEHKSSGVIIATPAGSHAWAKSAGGKVLSLTSRKFEYVIREPYHGRLSKPKMIAGLVPKDEKVIVTSKIWKGHDGIVVIDSYKQEFEFNNGDKLVVKASKQPLNLISF